MTVFRRILIKEILFKSATLATRKYRTVFTNDLCFSCSEIFPQGENNLLAAIANDRNLSEKYNLQGQ
jgi:hypothetical protein